MPRLRRSDVTAPGLLRRRYGRGFAYFDTDGKRVTDPVPLPPLWRERRDRAKHDRVLGFADRLPMVREKLCADLAGPGLTRDHVRMRGGVLVFEYAAKGGLQRTRSVADSDVVPAVRALRRRRDPSPELLAYRVGRAWRDMRSEDINGYLGEVAEGEFTAKDFRTWHVTVLIAVALAVSAPAARSRTARQRAVRRAYVEVAEYLGNTPAVCKASYVDPRVVDLCADGVTVASALESLGEEVSGGQLATQGHIEREVLRMLRHPDRAGRNR